MRILILVDKAVPDTGPHRNVVGSIQALSARKDVRVSVLCGESALSAEVLARINLQLGFVPRSLLSLFKNLFLVSRALRNVDVVYVPTGLKTFLYAWLCKGLFKNKAILAAGPNVTGIPLLMNIYNPSPLLTSHMADVWIEMSQIRVEQCVRAGTLREHIFCIPHSVDTKTFSPAFRDRNIWTSLGISTAAKIILFTGRIDADIKGIPELIEVFKKIKLTVKEAILVFVGRIQMDISKFKALPDVFFLGPKSGEEFVRFIASADLFMAASRYETFWFCPLEAMSCELPVVVSEVGAVADMIPENGKQGRRLAIVTPENHYKPESIESLAGAAIDLLQNESARLAMGKAGREFVSQKFSETRQAEKLVAAFETSLKRRRATKNS